jgi:cytochrome c-type biogenesis protein CcmF
MWTSLPQFGTGVLCAILVAAAYTFGVALAAANGRPRLLESARMGAYGTIALVGLAVLCLAYAFVSHDFRLDYVARYSDRTMTTPWLVAALWGGQDGSLLWWLFLTSFFSGVCVAWLKGRYRELQPFVIATLMSVLIFLALLMLFAANPFRTLVSGAVPDGAGLNYQLRNFYMIIHPPSLYIGFTSCAVPFAFAIAALATGRLDNEWIIATRKWMLFSWLFLGIGNFLGMLWAYEELGWGGYWAWDPVENAAFLPWLTASAYVHSVMIQERRGMLKMWNVILICLTFFLTYFGTFLTRSGLIASVHSFAQSGIGSWFLAYMLVIGVTCIVLIAWRSEKLRSLGQFDSVLSREIAFLLNNWILLSLLLFIAVATVYPRLSEWILSQSASVGPPFYNTFIPPIALILIFLMGTAPLLGWRKTSKELFYKSFRWPVAAMVVAAAAHWKFGQSIGFPAFVTVEPIYSGAVGRGMAWLGGKLPVITVALVAYNIAVVLQEFQRGVAARQAKRDETKETIFGSLFRLVAKSRRRYGGYIVHVGIAIMFLGFAGRAWESQKEISLEPNESVSIEEYKLTYKGARTEVDHEKRIVLADLDIWRHGEFVGTISPSKYIYKASPMQPSTEVARYITPRNDLYVTVGIVNTQTKIASFRIHVNTLVSLVWLGFAFILIGASVSMWPEASPQEAGAFAYVRALGTVATMVMMSLLLALYPSKAYGQQHEMRREGVVELTPEERTIFKQLLCDCGGCPHEALETCTCSWAHNARDQVRKDLAAGKSGAEIVTDYAAVHGSDAVIVQANKGMNRVLWAVPLGLAVVVGGVVVLRVRRWRRAAADADAARDKEAKKGKRSGKPDEYDDKLDAELRALDDDEDE